MRTRLFHSLAAAGLAMALSTVAFGSVPPVINYQGKLTQTSGCPVADGTCSMTFAIYPTETGGPALWSETNPAVQTKGGLFAVLLGSVINLPANIFDSPDRWFGVTVGTDPELSPRQRIASVPFALKAAVAGTVDDGAITTAKIAEGAVTQDKIAASTVLRGLNCVASSTVKQESSYHGDVTQLSWDTDVADANDMHSTTYPERITVPVAGMYMVGGSFEFQKNGNATSGRWQYYIYVNGIGHCFNDGYYANWVGDEHSHMCFEVPIVLNADDYVDFRVAQSSGHGSWTYAGSQVWVYKIGEAQ